jgi:hypothetical protein
LVINPSELGQPAFRYSSEGDKFGFGRGGAALQGLGKLLLLFGGLVFDLHSVLHSSFGFISPVQLLLQPSYFIFGCLQLGGVIFVALLLCG